MKGVKGSGEWSAAEIAKARRLVSEGLRSAKEIACELGHRYTGNTYYKLRQHCGDLLPAKRDYAKRGADGKRSRQDAPPIDYFRADAEEQERPQPWHPLRDNPRLLKAVGMAR